MITRIVKTLHSLGNFWIHAYMVSFELLYFKNVISFPWDKSAESSTFKAHSDRSIIMSVINSRLWSREGALFRYTMGSILNHQTDCN